MDRGRERGGSRVSTGSGRFSFAREGKTAGSRAADGCAGDLNSSRCARPLVSTGGLAFSRSRSRAQAGSSQPQMRAAHPAPRPSDAALSACAMNASQGPVWVAKRVGRGERSSRTSTGRGPSRSRGPTPHAAPRPERADQTRGCMSVAERAFGLRPDAAGSTAAATLRWGTELVSMRRPAGLGPAGLCLLRSGRARTSTRTNLRPRA